jgi:hypothetical protein
VPENFTWAIEFERRFTVEKTVEKFDFRYKNLITITQLAEIKSVGGLPFITFGNSLLLHDSDAAQ